MNFKKLITGMWLGAALCASAAFAAAPTYPFAARIDPYVYGTTPNHITPAQMDTSIKTHYNAWKAAAVVNVPTVAGGKAIRFSSSYIAVSEGLGYGMLISVLMAGHDPEAQALFDGLLRTVRARPAYNLPAPHNKYLAEWRLSPNGSSAGGGWSAMDGDEDIAMALLMADRQWGSSGTWNYKQEGVNTINALKAISFKSDGTSKGLSTPDVSRTSDYMPGHFRAFAKATGDTFWSTTVIDRSIALIERMQDVYSPGVGLMPDFIVATNTSTPKPSPGGMGDGVNTEMHYFANAQRNPWRWGTDYVQSGDTRWKEILKKMMTFFIAKTGGDPNKMAIGYHLNGTSMGTNWPSRGLIAGAMNGAQSDASFQPYLNASWEWMNSHFKTGYYDAELSLLSMLVASGNWWNPTPPTGTPLKTTQTTTPTPPPSASNRIQAENGVLAGIAARNDVWGYEGTGFVGPFSKAGDRLTVNFGQVTAGTHEIRIRYHAYGTQTNKVLVNGASRDVSFPVTGTAWAVKTISGVSLAAGTNSVAILKDWGYINVDYVEIVPAATGAKATDQNQAESGVLSGAGIGIRTDVAGYEGAGFVGGFTGTGAKLTMGFPNVVAGTYNVRIRYHAWGTQQNKVVVNGATRTESFASTGSGWVVKTLSNVALTAGSNSIAVVKDWGYIDVDWIEIAP